MMRRALLAVPLSIFLDLLPRHATQHRLRAVCPKQGPSQKHGCETGRDGDLEILKHVSPAPYPKGPAVAPQTQAVAYLVVEHFELSALLAKLFHALLLSADRTVRHANFMGQPHALEPQRAAVVADERDQELKAMFRSEELAGRDQTHVVFAGQPELSGTLGHLSFSSKIACGLGWP